MSNRDHRSTIRHFLFLLRALRRQVLSLSAELSDTLMCMPLPSAFPRTHDRHGRTPRYVRLFPGLPVWKTRRETFDSTVALVISELTERWPELQQSSLQPRTFLPQIQLPGKTTG